MIPLLLAGAAVAAWLLSQDEPKKAPPPKPTKKRMARPAILVVGRSGAGKSTLINWFSGSSSQAVNDIASTTRELSLVPASIGGRSVFLVDTPGVGEVGTHASYSRAVLDWCGLNEPIVACLMLIQADAKAHQEELDMIRSIRSLVPNAKVFYILSQVDKVSPTRDPLSETTWSAAQRAGGPKVGHIDEKISLVAVQFGCSLSDIIPVSSEERFNGDALSEKLAACLPSS